MPKTELVVCFQITITELVVNELTAIFIGLGLYLHIESLEKPCERPKEVLRNCIIQEYERRSAPQITFMVT